MPKIINVVIQLDPNAKTPLAEQIAEGIRVRVRGGALAAHARLPPARALAKRLGVNPATVAAAYRKLAAEGRVEARVGSGTYVCPQLDIPGAPVAESAPTGVGGGEIFPTAVLKRIIGHILDREGAGAFGPTGVAGHPPLLDELRGYLRENAVELGGDELVIFSGAQQGLSVIVQALLHRDDWVVVERPTYPGILRLLQRAGARIEAVDLLADGGPDLRALERLFRTRPIRMFYAMPVYQNPTGACYPPEARRRLLELCAKHGVTLVEDDSQSDLDFGGGQFHPLRAEVSAVVPGKRATRNAQHETPEIIYLKSFSRLLMPGFRLGFCMAPPRVAEQLRRVKEESDLFSSGFFQRVLHLFLHHGYFREHLARLQALEAARFGEAVRRVEKELLPRGFRWLRPQGGPRVWLQLPAGTAAAAFFAESAKRGLPLKPGAEFAPDGSTTDWFALETADLAGRPGTELVRALAAMV
jgi:DNA-binding transcriptional MocR family regulator